MTQHPTARPSFLAAALLTLAALALAACTPATANQPSAATPTAALAIGEPAPPTPTASPSAPVRAFLLDGSGAVSTWAPGEAEPAPLATLPAGAYGVALSPNGLWAAYVADGRAYVRELAGDALYDISPGGAPLAGEPMGGFRWAPDSTALLFDLAAAEDMVNNPAATIFRADMGPGIPLPASAIADGFGPAWSPDGARIAYAAPPYDPGTLWGGGPGGALSIADSRGGSPRPLGDLLVYPGWQPILWSADGARLAAGTAVLEADSGELAFAAPANEREVLGAFQWIDATGDQAGLWRAARTSLSREPGLFVEQDEYVLVGADGSAQLLAQSSPMECPCMPLAAQLEGFWSPTGDALLASGPLASDERAALRLIGADGAARELALPPDLFPRLPAHWWPDGGLLLTLGMPGVTESWFFPAGDGEPQPIGGGAVLGLAR